MFNRFTRWIVPVLATVAAIILAPIIEAMPWDGEVEGDGQ